MPTTRPRYQITDTGEVSEMLDLAERVWSSSSRKELLLRLAALGRDELARRASEREEIDGQERQRVALGHAADLVDADSLLGDAAWR